MLPPLSLYVHFPWCVRKCPYCDFNSHALTTSVDEVAYVDTLLDDLGRDLESIQARKLVSIFFGGGTPSLLSGASVDRILRRLRELELLEPACEVSLEANPGTADIAHFSDYRSAGVNRLSIGVQSFDDEHLRDLGRIHDSGEARVALGLVRESGFSSFNVDLMYGLPNQTAAGAERDIAQVLEFNPPHVSHYELTIEPNTRFHRYPPVRPDEDVLTDMESGCGRLLAASGFARYEVSAWSKPSAQCRHNRHYWTFGDYLGVGAGAHSKLSDPHGGVVRIVKHKHPRRYLESRERGDYVMSRQRIVGAELGFEFMLNALRLEDGFSLDLFESRTELGRDEVLPTLEQAAELGLLELDRVSVRPTALGKRFHNDLVAMFAPGGRPGERVVPRAML